MQLFAAAESLLLAVAFIASTSDVVISEEVSGECPDPLCSGHGRCEGSFCNCETQWAGEKCDYFIQEGAVPEVGQSLSEVDSALDAAEEGEVSCTEICVGHGVCDSGMCKCDAGWSGPDCRTEARCDANCNSPSGMCVAGRCVCTEGFAGATCAEMSCSNDCWGHGTCISGKCACETGWMSEECDVQVPTTTPPAPNTGAPDYSIVPIVGAGTGAEAGVPSGTPVATAAAQSPAPALASLPPLPSVVVVPSAGVTANAVPPGLVPSDNELRDATARAAATVKNLRSAVDSAQGQMDAKTSIETADPNIRILRGAISGYPNEAPPSQLEPARDIVKRAQAAVATAAAAMAAQAAADASGVAVAPPVLAASVMPLAGAVKAAPVSSGLGRPSIPAGVGPRILNSAPGFTVAQSWAVPNVINGGAVPPGFTPSSPVPLGVTAVYGTPPGPAAVVATAAEPSGSSLGTVSDLRAGLLQSSSDSDASAVAIPCIVEDCSGHGACIDGQCKCAESWNGDACDQQQCPKDCSERGTCMQGICACHVEYFGTGCEYARCPEDCSGRGFCRSGTCVCSPGYAGDGCQTVVKQLTKPSTAGQVTVKRVNLKGALSAYTGVQKPECPDSCNANGRCDDDGRCTCFGGFSGEACSDYCPNGCNGRGECAEGQCLCMTGFTGEDCSLQTCCSGHGNCDVPGSCVCMPGWMGDQCEVKMFCPDPLCNGRGKCYEDEGLCKCNPGWSGLGCTEPPSECALCPPNGSCDRSTGKCMCGEAVCPDYSAASPAAALIASLGRIQSSSWTEDGSTPAANHVQALTLLGNSRNVQPAAPSAAPYVPPPPDCNEPNGNWDDTMGTCNCQTMWYGQRCEEKHCSDWTPQGSPDCSGNGRCVAGNCICSAGFGLTKGLAGPNVCKDAVCPLDCGDHGLCKGNKCICQDGWQGPSCRMPKCVNDCSGRGSCQFGSAQSRGECICEYGYALPDCSQPSVFTLIPGCPNDCGGKGLCFAGKCVCSAGSYGVDCSKQECPAGKSGPGCMLNGCQRDCDGHGLCMGGQCLCDGSHGGSDCSIPLVCWDSCWEKCVYDLEGETCEFCKGACLTAFGPVVGHHDPLSESISTLAVGAHAGRTNQSYNGQSRRSAREPGRPKNNWWGTAFLTKSQHAFSYRTPAHRKRNRRQAVGFGNDTHLVSRKEDARRSNSTRSTFSLTDGTSGKPKQNLTTSFMAVNSSDTRANGTRRKTLRNQHHAEQHTTLRHRHHAEVSVVRLKQ